MGGLLYILILLLCCVEFWFHYKLITHIRKDLTVKQKSYIMSIKNSLTLFLISLYFNCQYFFSEISYDNVCIFAVLYFTSYLIMDIYIGCNEYPEYLKSLDGYPHHIIYIFINIISLYLNLYPVYILFMISELPTLLLGIGSFDKTLRNDKLFGISFFLTRIFYHILLTWIFRNNTTTFRLGMLTLIPHMYWGYNWIKKYY